MSGTTFFPIFVNTSGTVSSQIPWTKSTVSYNNSTSTLSITNASVSTTLTIGGTNTLTYDAGSTRTVFSGGSGISVNSGVSVGTGYTSPSIVGLSMICNSGSTDVIVIYDNTIATMLFNINGVRITTTLPITSTGGFIGNLTGRATLIATTLQTTGTQFITFVPLSATTSAGQVAGTHASLSYNVNSSLLTVPNITSSGTHSVNLLEATSGVSILNSSYLELNSSTLKRWLINCSADPTNDLGFAYYNGVFAVTLATLSQTGTFSTTNVSATTLVSAPTLTATGTVNCAKIVQTGTSVSTFAGSIQMVGDLDFNTGGLIYQRDQLLPNSRTYYQTYNGEFYLVKQQISPIVNSIIFYGSSTIFHITAQLQVGDNALYGTGTSASPNIAGFLSSTVTSGSYASLQLGGSSTTFNSWFWLSYRYSAFGYGKMEFSNYGVASAFFIYSYGDTTQPGNSYAVNHINTSDRRLKEHIKEIPLDDAKAIINKLKPKTFCWKDRNGTDSSGKIISCPISLNCCKKNWGFIAQEIETDFDVANHPIGLHSIQPNEEKTQAVDYCQVVAPLVKVVQDLMLQQSSLMREIELLKANFLELKVNV
jgi:hypothetical protein